MSLSRKHELLRDETATLKTEIWNAYPENLSLTSSGSARLAQLAIAGYTQLAADSVLLEKDRDSLFTLIENSVRELDLAFASGTIEDRKKCIEVLLELGLNLLGLERKRAGFSGQEVSQSLDKIVETLKIWERSDGGESCAREVVDQMLRGMKMVLSGKGMVARMAEEIEGRLPKHDLSAGFIDSSRKAIQGNVYYRIVDDGLSKFGNDSATGLRWARHLGAVQVSSNPVIAARAYEEIDELWRKFKIVASAHSEWREDPEKYADEIALYGTVVSLLPNILDFRPLALLSNFEDGMVSIQLNPRIASSVEESMKDALKFYSILGEILKGYDLRLTGSGSSGKVRPNIVFKVSTLGPEAIRLTESLDKIGVGTNNTVTFTVSQEVNLTIAAMKGLAAALKAGIPITTIYITNMEGRLEDHLRESEAFRILSAALGKSNTNDREAKMRSIAKSAGAVDEISKSGNSIEAQISTISSKKFLKSLTDPWFIEAIGKQEEPHLKQLEADIRMSGIYVTRRVFQLAFNPALKQKWVAYIKKSFHISDEEAVHVVEAVNLLPASKRRAEDTYLVLGDSGIANLTNTEFPDHQLKVLQRSREAGFALLNFRNSISAKPDPAILDRLLKIPDFRKAYELTTALVEELKTVGVEVPDERGGIVPEEWEGYGPVRKTLDEFTGAYVSFQRKLLNEVAKPSATGSTGKEEEEEDEREIPATSPKPK